MQTKELKEKVDDLLTKQKWYISINPTFGASPNVKAPQNLELKKVVWIPYIRFDGARRVFYEHPNNLTELKAAMVDYFSKEGDPLTFPSIELTEIKKGSENDFYTVDGESSKQINKLLNKDEQ